MERSKVVLGWKASLLDDPQIAENRLYNSLPLLLFILEFFKNAK